MMTEKEVRELRDALQWARVQPCDCRGTKHEFRREMGGLLMQAAIEVLTDVLGERKDSPNLTMLQRYWEQS